MYGQSKNRNRNLFNPRCFLFSYRLVFFTICSVLCFIQVYKICEIYFAFDVSTLVSYQNVLSVTVPAITLCMSKAALLRPEHLARLGSRRDRKSIENYLNNMTVSQQFDALYSEDELFGKDCLIMRPKTMESDTEEDYVHCSVITPIRRAVDLHSICFILFSNFNKEPVGNYTFEFDVTIKNYFLEIISMRVKANVSEIHLFIHNKKARIGDSFDYNHINLLYEPSTKSCIKYHITEINLLPAPYVTNCIDYTEFGHLSVADCILQCKIRYFRDRFKGWPGNYLCFNDTDQKMVDVLSLIGDNSSLDLRLGKECRRECGQHSDCFTQFFNFFEVKVPAPNETDFLVNIFAPDFPDLVYRNSPRMAIDEMLCFVASIVSIWFGFSFTHFSEHTIGCCLSLNQYINTYRDTRLKTKTKETNDRFIENYLDKRCQKKMNSNTDFTLYCNKY